MADLGLIISDYLEKIWASLLCKLFSNGCEQLTKAEVKESQAIASVRIYYAINTT